MDRVNRRTFLMHVGAGAAGAYGLATATVSGTQTADAPAADKPASSGPQKLSVYPFGKNIWVRINDRPFTCYRANADQKGPYFFPVYGVSGMPMTEEASEPYPHHRSLFFGCDRMNGQNFWQEGNDRGQILSRGPRGELSESKEQAVITDVCAWTPPGKDPIIEDKRRFTIAAPSDLMRFIDADITLNAMTDIHVNQTNHSLFAIRAALELAPKGGGMLINSEGQSGEKQTLGKPAKWCGYQGTRHGVTESIVMFDHPANPFGPKCPWFTRDYGNISPTPFLWLDEKGWDLAKGKSIRLRYRVLVLKGPIERERLNALWNEFAAAPAPR